VTLLLVQFGIALQVRRKSRRAVKKITEKFVSMYTIIWLGNQNPALTANDKLNLIWFDLFVDGQKIYLMILLI